jgi:RND family efflux transporter MFP subunit
VKRAESDYRRIKRIRERDPGAASAAMLDKAIQVRDSAQADVLALKADVDAASDALSYTYLKAPYAGTIVRTFVENFETVQAKQPIARLLDISKIEMIVDLPENLIKFATDPEASLKINVYFDPYPGHKIPAKIEEVGKEASEITRTYPVNLIMNQPTDFQILPGMAGTARGSVQLSPDDPEAGIRVPSTAVFSPPESGGSFVWVIDPETKKVSRRQVEVGKITNTGTLIRKGLKPGEWVAIAGVHHLKEGQQVTIMDETPQETAA